ncbi:MAG: sialidase [Gemmatimonadota bacterium]|nr:sialidase [Gemmatimonadota bacterium]
MRSTVLRFAGALSLAVSLGALAVHPRPGRAQEAPTSAFASMQYRHIGPLGNRITSVTGVPGDRFTYYAGAASGGLWKTEDGGVNWRPVFDDQPVHSVGEVEVSPSDPNTVWAGTGEPFIRSNVSIGNGVWKSTDAGETWTHMGLEGTGRISRIIAHPTNPDIVYAAAIGHGYAAQPERGIYRTTDGGATWEHVLFVDEETGASDLVMDPNNPRILFAGTWQIAIRTWTRTSGGPGSAIHVSRDGGTTWTRLAGNGLPTREIGKIALCMSRADSRRIYALIETGDGVPWEGGDTDGGELWRSDDGGHNWSLVSYDRDLAGRTAYYTRCEANPDDADEAYFLAAVYSTTLDGGVTSSAAGFLEGPVWDHHDMWIDPQDGDRQIVGGDGGLAISGNRGRTWFRAQLPIAQMYHVTVDNAIPYNVMGNRQDGPSTRGPSNSRMGGGIFGVGIPRGLWHSVGGGESGFATPDPTDPDIVWSSASGVGAGGGIVSRWDARTGQHREVEVWPESTTGHPADSLRYRFQWTFPLLISPHDNNTVYVTSQHVHRTTNRGQSWDVISPDLSTNNRSRMGISGGLTPDNIGVEYCCVIYAFDESPLEPGVLWAGTNDGLMHVSRDGGASWTNVTANIPDLPPDGVVRGIDASRYTAGKAYVVIEHHQVGDFEARAYRTEDYGESWTPITSGIDDGVLSYTRSIHEDPVRPGLLYLGTEASVYVSFDDGDRWQRFHTDLPPAPMYGLVVQEHFNDLVVGTYGRGYWILDDVTPLQQLTPEVAASAAHLFAPRPAYRFQSISAPFTMFDDQSDGENPPYGASLNYWLAEATDDSVVVEIANAAGEVVRTLEGTANAGVNRLWWDLMNEPVEEVRLRTKPLHGEDVSLGEDRRRPLPGGPLGGPGAGTFLQAPGMYTVTLRVGDEALTQQLEVRKDPHSEGTLADIEAQLAALADIRADLEATGELINRVEWVRRQLLDVRAVLEDRGDTPELVAAADALNQRLIAAEDGLFQMRATGTGQDAIRYPARLIERLGYLFTTVSIGDFPPTDQQGEVHVILEQRLLRIREAIEEVLEDELADFNRRIQALGMGVIS